MTQTTTAITPAAAPFDFAPLLAPGLPAPAVKWNGFPRYNFVGGHNDAEQVPVADLIAAATSVLGREGRTLASYGLESGPLGYRRLREFLVGKLKADAGISCAVGRDPHHLRLAAGLELVNGILLSRGDTVLIEQVTYFGSLNRLARLGVNPIGIPLDHEGLRMDALVGDARRSQGARHQAEIHLHHPDRAESDRHHHGRRAPAGTAAARRSAQCPDLRGRLLCRPDLGRPASAGDLRHEQKPQRHPHRLVLQIDRAGAAGRLRRGGLERALAHAAAQDRCRLGRARADGAGGILRAAFRHPRAGTDPRACAPSSTP